MFKTTITLILTSTILIVNAPCFGKTEGTHQEKLDVLKKETADLAAAIKDYSLEHRDQLLSKAKKAIDTLDQDIEKLEAMLQKDCAIKGDQLESKLEAAAKNLRKKRIKVAELYGELKNASESTWKRTKDGFMVSYDALYHAWEQAKQEMSEEQSDKHSKN